MTTYLAHIRNGDDRFTHALCGKDRTCVRWSFVDLAHAKANAKAGSVLELCAECERVAEGNVG